DCRLEPGISAWADQRQTQGRCAAGNLAGGSAAARRAAGDFESGVDLFDWRTRSNPGRFGNRETIFADQTPCCSDFANQTKEWEPRFDLGPRGAASAAHLADSGSSR